MIATPFRDANFEAGLGVEPPRELVARDDAEGARVEGDLRPRMVGGGAFDPAVVVPSMSNATSKDRRQNGQDKTISKSLED